MKLLHVEYRQNGTRIGKRGTPIKNIGKWVTYQCGPCGAIVQRWGYSGRSANSCGCSRKVKHGLAQKHPLYRVWHGMKDRCLNPTSKARERYGGRGITICPEWHEFLPFYEWAIAKGWQEGLYFDRKNFDGNYEPNNCRFISVLESNRNRSNTTITPEQALQIHACLTKGESSKKIAEELNVPFTTVINVRAGKCWQLKDLTPTT